MGEGSTTLCSPPARATGSTRPTSAPDFATPRGRGGVRPSRGQRPVPHHLRRTVGTLITHEVGLDAAREQLGHSDGSTTYQHYVGKREVAPDVRPTLDVFFSALPEAVPLLAREA